MKPYTVSIDIDLPRDKVIELFENADNMVHWQTGLQSFEHLSGEPGQPGAKSKLVYRMGKKSCDLIETITKRNLPDEFNGCYEWDSGKNTLDNKFLELGPNKTRWESTCSYEMKTLFMKAMALVMSGSFKKQNLKFLENFKAFCEHGTSGAEQKS